MILRFQDSCPKGYYMDSFINILLVLISSLVTILAILCAYANLQIYDSENLLKEKLVSLSDSCCSASFKDNYNIRFSQISIKIEEYKTIYTSLNAECERINGKRNQFRLILQLIVALISISLFLCLYSFLLSIDSSYWIAPIIVLILVLLLLISIFCIYKFLIESATNTFMPYMSIDEKYPDPKLLRLPTKELSILDAPVLTNLPLYLFVALNVITVYDTKSDTNYPSFMLTQLKDIDTSKYASVAHILFPDTHEPHPIFNADIYFYDFSDKLKIKTSHYTISNDLIDTSKTVTSFNNSIVIYIPIVFDAIKAIKVIFNNVSDVNNITPKSITYYKIEGSNTFFPGNSTEIIPTQQIRYDKCYFAEKPN